MLSLPLTAAKRSPANGGAGPVKRARDVKQSAGSHIRPGKDRLLHGCPRSRHAKVIRLRKSARRRPECEVDHESLTEFRQISDLGHSS